MILLNSVDGSVIFHFWCCSIFWVVININDMKVCVLLLKYRVKVLKNIIFMVIFITGHNNTEWQLISYWFPGLFVFVEVIFFLIWHDVIDLFLFDFTIWIVPATFVLTDFTVFYIKFVIFCIVKLCNFNELFGHFVLLFANLCVSHRVNWISVVTAWFFTHFIHLNQYRIVKLSFWNLSMSWNWCWLFSRFSFQRILLRMHWLRKLLWFWCLCIGIFLRLCIFYNLIILNFFFLN